MQRARVDVDLGAIAWNLQSLRRKLGSHPKIMGVVKANGYGHGAVVVARTLKSAGAEQLAVATPDEALTLRNSSIEGPITVLGPVCDADFPELFDAELTLTILDPESAKQIADRAREEGQRVHVHVKVNTGMHRFGLNPKEVPGVLQDLATNPFVSVYSLATHLACAENKEKTQQQILKFHSLRRRLRALKLLPNLFHLANSAGTILRDARTDDLVRPGIALYGIDPTGRFHQNGGVDLRPALSVKSRLASIRQVPKGRAIGYGGTWVTKRPTRLGLISIGYGDGWPYLESNRGHVLVHGQPCPILGTVMMDSMAIDLTDFYSSSKELKIGDEVVLLGQQGDQSILAEDLAKRAGTIPYELPCQLGNRLPRNYIDGIRSTAASHTGLPLH
jgi:alanine racemase